MEPNHPPAQLDGPREHLRLRRQRDAQAGLSQLRLKARCVGGVRSDGRQIGQKILGGHRLPECRRQKLKESRRYVRRRRLGIAPEWEDATAEGTLVVVVVWN